MIPGGYTAASEYEVTYTYANGVVHTCRSTTASEWHGGVEGPQGPAARHQVHRLRRLDLGHPRRDQGQRPRDPQPRSCPTSATRVYVSNDHMGNFVDCVKIAQAPDLPGRGRPPLGQPRATWA